MYVKMRSLAARELPTRLADGRVVTLRQLYDEVVGECVARRLFDALRRCPPAAVGDVVGDGVVEQNRLLRDNAHLLPQAPEVRDANVHAIHED